MFFQQHWTDDDGNPAGGCTTGRGFTIAWQNGPLKAYRDDEECVKVKNGATHKE